MFKNIFSWKFKKHLRVWRKTLGPPKNIPVLQTCAEKKIDVPKHLVPGAEKTLWMSSKHQMVKKTLLGR